MTKSLHIFTHFLLYIKQGVPRAFLPHVQQNRKTTFSGKKLQKTKPKIPEIFWRGTWMLVITFHQHCLWQCKKLHTIKKKKKMPYIQGSAFNTWRTPVKITGPNILLTKTRSILWMQTHYNLHTTVDTTINISCSYYYILVSLSAHYRLHMLQLKVRSSHRHYISWSTTKKYSHISSQWAEKILNEVRLL